MQMPFLEFPKLFQNVHVMKLETRQKNLPHGGYHYCTRAQKQWSRFQHDVDEVFPLSIKSEYNVAPTILTTQLNSNNQQQKDDTNIG